MTVPASIPLEAVPTAWTSLPADVRDEVGRLALRRELLLHAGTVFTGDLPGTCIVLLGRDERQAAFDAADATAREIADLLGDHLPEFFGCEPSDAHPNGTDPPWATPTVLPAETDEDIIAMLDGQP